MASIITFVSGEAALVFSAGRGVSRNMSTAVNIDGLNQGYRGLLSSDRIDALPAVSH